MTIDGAGNAATTEHHRQRRRPGEHRGDDPGLGARHHRAVHRHHDQRQRHRYHPELHGGWFSATPGAGNDYTTLSGTVTILAGATTATIDVTVLDDSLLEGTEDVIVTLASITAGDPDVTIDGAGNAATTEHHDNDTPPW